MTARNPARQQTGFCSAVAPILHRIDRWSYRVLRAAGWGAIALAVVGAAMGA